HHVVVASGEVHRRRIEGPQLIQRDERVFAAAREVHGATRGGHELREWRATYAVRARIHRETPAFDLTRRATRSAVGCMPNDAARHNGRMGIDLPRKTGDLEVALPC